MLEFEQTPNPLRDTLAKEPIEQEKGIVKVPTGPGLGIEIDRESPQEIQGGVMGSGTKIVDVKAYPTSFRVPKERQVSLGIGTMTKRDCVMVKVTTEDGLVGWGESHHARAPGTIGQLVNTTLRGLVVGMDATDTVGIWARIYKMQLGKPRRGRGPPPWR